MNLSLSRSRSRPRATAPTTRARRLVPALTAATALGVAGLVAPPAADAHAVPSPGGGQDASRAAQRTLPYQDRDLAVRKRVRDLLSRMTLAEKVGQMTQAERADVADDPSLVTSQRLGSLLSGGGSVPESNTPQGWADMVDDFQDAALNTRLGIPLLYGVDSVHGHGNLYGATIFPHNIGLGASRDARLVKQIGDITARETRASGPQWAFAPCLCVARDDRWGRTYESYGESPALVTRMESVIDGLQGGRAARIDRSHVLATAKHFAGDGLTTFGTGSGDYPIDQGVDQVDHATFDKLALAPYWPAVLKHHVGSVMPSYSSVDWTEDGLGNPVKMHASKELIAGVLKKSMRFHGFVISDYSAIHQIPGDYPTQVATSVNAGVDMFMEPANTANFEKTLTAAVRSGDVRVRRVDDAVSRILTAKFDLGLFEHPYTDRKAQKQIGNAAHRKVARQAVRESQVLLKNSRGTLPLRPRSTAYVAGSNADNIGNQSGGWTLTWQGGSTNVVPATPSWTGSATGPAA